ncbi:right-handed parallel beta-helix repeat-containing protein [Methanofollis formosanus]|nr:right-handed parallel beta-helix repeat-containing protein [Methanofollis formosanus]
MGRLTGSWLFVVLILPIISGVPASAGVITVAAVGSSESQGADYLCDGVSDQVEIQEALDRAGGGEKVLLRPGIYHCDDSITLREGFCLEGSDKETTTLEFVGGWIGVVAKDHTNLRHLTISGNGAVWVRGSHVTVQWVTVTGDPRMNGGFTVWAEGRIIEDVVFEDCTAIDLSWTGFNVDGRGDSILVRGLRYERCQAVRCGADDNSHPWSAGFILAEHNDLEDTIVKDCYAEDNWESGFHIEPAVSVKNVVLENCTAVKNGLRKNCSYPESASPELKGLTFGAGFTINNAATVKRCIAEENYRGYFLWSTDGAHFEDCSAVRSYKDDYAIVHHSGYTAGNSFVDCLSTEAGRHALSIRNAANLRFENFTAFSPAGDGHSCIQIGGYEPSLDRDYPCEASFFDLNIEGGGSPNIVYVYLGRDLTLSGEIETAVSCPLLIASDGQRAVGGKTTRGVTIEGMRITMGGPGAGVCVSETLTDAGTVSVLDTVIFGDSVSTGIRNEAQGEVVVSNISIASGGDEYVGEDRSGIPIFGKIFDFIRDLFSGIIMISCG